MKRGIVAFLAIAGLVAIGFWQWGGSGNGGPAAGGAGGFAVPVMLAPVQAKSLDVTIESVGTLVANESVTLRPEITGRITDIYFTEGQPVKKGEKLFQLDDRMARAEVKQAEASLKLARLNFSRFEKLVNTGAATRRRYDEARAELAVAEANLDVARTRLDYTAIKAPFDGVVGLRHISPGELVNVGQDLANFVSYDPMKVNFSIPETKAAKLKIDQAIKIEVEALPDQLFNGIVYALDPQLDVEGRSVSLRARVPNPDSVLKPGYFARVKLNIARKEGALTVPESAIVPQGNQKFVYLLLPDNTVNLVPVTLGERLTGEVEILSGLHEGDQVVISGQIKLRSGAKVMDIAAQKADTRPPATPSASPEKLDEAAQEAETAISGGEVGDDGVTAKPDIESESETNQDAPLANDVQEQE